MAYLSKKGRRPGEYASKSAHVHVVNSPSVQSFLAQCNLPKRAEEVALSQHTVEAVAPSAHNPIRFIVAIDGGYSEVPVQVEFPSATIAFFQFGALTFSIQDLEDLEHQPFIDPDDMSKLKQIQRLELILPIRNVTLQGQPTLTHSVRKAIYDFFRTSMDEGLKTLRWFLFEEYNPTTGAWNLASCPNCRERNIALHRNQILRDFTFQCPQCTETIYITDVFRLHEVIDDEIGAGGILGYVTTTIEQMLLVHLIRLIMETKPSLLNEILFIKDGPLAFFGQTANMHKPMRSLIRYLQRQRNLFLAGLEKSGPFVEHADEIARKINAGHFLIIDNDYIYKYIIPGHPDSARPYGVTTYYGNKLIFRSIDEKVYVVTLPTSEVLAHPQEKDFLNLQVILKNVEKLRCDMYDDALFPIALVNKLVSLSDHPSSRILQKFAVDTMNITRSKHVLATIK